MKACFLLIRPVPVKSKRFFAPEFVFIFGIAIIVLIVKQPAKITIFRGITKKARFFLQSAFGFAPLDAAIADGTIDLRGIDVSSAVVYDEQGTPSTVAIPTESLYGLLDLGIDNRDAYLCVMITSQNQQTAFSFVNWIIENMLAEKPQWLVEQEESASSQADFTPSDIASY